MLKETIKKTQKNLEKNVKENHQSFIAKNYVKLLSFLRPIYFHNEFLLINGLKKKKSEAPQSILFFTVHKSASTFIKNTIMGLVSSKLVPINLPGYLPPEKHKVYFNDANKMRGILQDKGFFYGAFRSFYNFPNMENFRILLMLRDPRDVLTSMFFTVLYNHPVGRKEVLDERNKYKDFTIDEFVLEQAPGFKKKYEDYCRELLNRQNVLFLKYEDMISDFPNWLKKLSAFLNVEDKDDFINDLIKKTTFKVKAEDPKSFIRNIQAGDHKNKLKPDTINILTNLFKDELMQLGYTL